MATSRHRRATHPRTPPRGNNRSVPVTIEAPRQPEVLELLTLSDEYALSLYPADSCYMLDVGDLERPDVAVFVARENGEALGMGALVDRGDGSAELKRMFVHDRARGRGIARGVLSAIEAHARAAGIRVIQLETGPKQLAAIALYERHGYARIPNFGQYVGDEFSVCMEKSLRQPAP